jgi:hypothetical protein
MSLYLAKIPKSGPGERGRYVTSGHKQNGATRGDALVHARALDEYKKWSGSQPSSPAPSASRALEMDAMDEFQEADILWPDTTTGDELVVLVSFATADMAVEEPYGAAASSSVTVTGFEEPVFLPGAAGPSSSAGANPDDADSCDEEDWQEADVLWPDTVGVVVPRGGGGGGGGGLLLPFPGQHVVSPAGVRRERDRWRPAASSPIDIPTNVVAERRRLY